MAEKYSADLLSVVVAKIAQTIGYNCTQSAPLETLQDIMQRYIQKMAHDLHSHAQHANRVEPNIKDAALALRNLNVNITDLKEYIENVEPIPLDQQVPAYPIKMPSNLNLLNCDSEVELPRRAHEFKHLPIGKLLKKYQLSSDEFKDLLRQNYRGDRQQQLDCVVMTPDGLIVSRVKGKLPLPYVPKIIKRKMGKNM